MLYGVLGVWLARRVWGAGVHASICQEEGPKPFRLGTPGCFLPTSQHWAEGDTKRQPSGEVKGMGWSQGAWV